MANRQIDRRVKGIDKTLPAPVGGWNARDAITSMPITDAIRLENWFPGPTSVDLRPGTSVHMTQIPGTVKTLAVYHELDGDSSMWAFTDSGVFEATFGGQSGGLILWARTNGKHQWEQFGDGTNNWLIAVNGVDKPWYWNGTNAVLVDGATSPAITGITTTTIVSVAVFKEQLFFIQNDKMGFAFLPKGDAGGAVSLFDLSSVASDGGYLMAICSWSRDAGDGPDDFWVGITSEGEAIVYQGTDPSSANTWVLVGVFKIGKPLGRRCVLKKFGADPIILTQDGAFPMSAVLQSGDARHKYALSYKIQQAISDAALVALDVFGWKILSFPEQKALIVNVPIAEDGPHEQYVMNTITKAWCKFTGWSAEDFAVMDGDLYYAQGNRIFRAWVDGVTDDNGTDIVATAVQAYSDFGSGLIKEPVMFKPILETSRTIDYATGVDTDFATIGFTGTTALADNLDGVWGETDWDEVNWTSDNNIVQNWGGTASWPGRWLSGKLRVVSSSSNGLAAKWLGSVMRFTQGNGL
jgi:hypothetical protein